MKIKKFFKKFLKLLLLVLSFITGYGVFKYISPNVVNLSSTEIKSYLYNIDQHNIKKIHIENMEGTMWHKIRLYNNKKKVFCSVVSPYSIVTKLIDSLEIPIHYGKEYYSWFFVFRMITSCFASIMVYIMAWSILGRANFGSNNSAFKTIKVDEEFTIDDLVGMTAIKGLYHRIIRNIKMIRESNKDPNKSEKKKQNIPGILLVGKPGNGKTYSVKAIAGSIKKALGACHLINANASGFNDRFIGVGASNVKKLFTYARALQKRTGEFVLIFLDEVDSMGSRKERHGGSENKRTINALLSELDGLERNDNILVISATNNKDDIDKALLRSGRISRKILIRKPNLLDLQELIDFELKKSHKNNSLTKDQRKKIAKMLKGKPRSVVSHILNLAKEVQVKEFDDEQKKLKNSKEKNTKPKKLKDKKLTFKHVETACIEDWMGIELPINTAAPEELKNTAYHEAGHAMVSAIFCKMNKRWPKNLKSPEYYEIIMASIVPRSNSLGVVLYYDTETNLKSNYFFLARILTALAGRAGEYIYMGANKLTHGCSSDFQNAREAINTHILYMMGKNDGISGSFMVENMSEYEKKQLAIKRGEMLKDFVNYCEELVRDNSIIMHKIAKLLLKKPNVMANEIYKIVNSSKLVFSEKRFLEVFNKYSTVLEVC